ncbi:uteroglobin [Antechinus flavipes]|uniref:uteroglobin n=1 Tax=Antechinus flavipes TaxID=38775 RepID=UPI002235C7E8|nr:uteroglobin [Antechinus flavipes]
MGQTNGASRSNSAMKLTVVCSALALVLCFGWASADGCPTFPEVAEILIKGTAQKYLESIQCFQPDETMEAAGKLLKEQVDVLSNVTKMDIMRLMEKILTAN